MMIVILFAMAVHIVQGGSNAALLGFSHYSSIGSIHRKQKNFLEQSAKMKIPFVKYLHGREQDKVLFSSPGVTINNDSNKPQRQQGKPKKRYGGGRPENAHVRSIMALLQTNLADDKEKEHEEPRKITKEWFKVRNYLYRSSKTKSQVSTQQVQDTLDFLNGQFPNNVELQRRIIQNCPRIFKKSMDNQLLPTIEFLVGLYGEDGMIQAVSRNPTLLLTQGLGYRSNAPTADSSSYTCIDSTIINNSKHESDEESVESYLEEKLQISSSSMQKLKRSNPTIFQLSVSKNIIPIVQFLSNIFPVEDKQNFNKKVNKIICTVPTILSLSISDNLQPTLDTLMEKCGLENDDNGSKSDVQHVVGCSPQILCLSTKGNLIPSISFLEDVLLDRRRYDQPMTTATPKDNEEKKELLRKCVTRHPQILTLSLDNLQAKVAYFDAIENVPIIHKQQPGGDASSSSPLSSIDMSLAARILISAPSVYSLSLQQNIIPTIECLAKFWGVQCPDNEIHSSTSNNAMPASVAEAKMGGKASGELNGSDENILTRRLKEYPPVLTLSLEGNLEPTIQFYNATGYVHLDTNGNLLTLSSQDNAGHSKKGKTTNVMTTTIRARYLATSLYNRLLPRWHYLKGKGARRLNTDVEALGEVEGSDKSIINNNDHDVINSKKKRAKKSDLPPLHLLAGASDSIFCQNLQLNKDDYMSFKEGAIPRLKFGSQFETWLKTGRPIDDV